MWAGSRATARTTKGTKAQPSTAKARDYSNYAYDSGKGFGKFEGGKSSWEDGKSEQPAEPGPQQEIEVTDKITMDGVELSMESTLSASSAVREKAGLSKAGSKKCFHRLDTQRGNDFGQAIFRPSPTSLPTIQGHTDGNRTKTCKFRGLGLLLRKGGLDLPNWLLVEIHQVL